MNYKAEDLKRILSELQNTHMGLSRTELGKVIKAIDLAKTEDISDQSNPELYKQVTLLLSNARTTLTKQPVTMIAGADVDLRNKIDKVLEVFGEKRPKPPTHNAT